RRQRAMLVEPADLLGQLLLPAVAPELDLVGLHRVHAKLTLLPGAHPLGPGVTEKAVGKQAKLVRLVRQRDGSPLRPEARLLQRDAIRARPEVGIDRS